MAIPRRTLLKRFTALAGLGLAGGLAWRWVPGSQPVDLSAWRGFSSEDVALLNHIADTIIPRTDTPGAADAGVGEFIAGVVTDCFDPDEQAVFVAGLRLIASACLTRYGRDFAAASDAERIDLLTDIQAEQARYELWSRVQRGWSRLVGRSAPPRQLPHYFTTMKQLTVHGYFTSEPGATQALRHISIPGDYDGAVPYRRGDRSWSM